MTDYTKEVAEVLASSDALGYWAYGRTLEEEITSADGALNSTGKLAAESTTLSDADVVKDASKLASQSISLTDTVKKTPGRTLEEALVLVDSASTVNMIYTAKFIQGNPNSIESLVENYLATVGVKGVIQAISCVPISSDNFGVLIVHS
jgi:hypothetical protein